MQTKKIIQIYREGWWLILRCLVFAIALWVVLLPLKILEAFEDKISPTANSIILLVFFLVYFPFAVYLAYHIVKDINKTDHRFVPLIDRIRKKTRQSEE